MWRSGRMALLCAFLLLISGCGAIWESMHPSQANALPPYAFHLASASDKPGLLPWSNLTGQHTLYLQREALLTRVDIKGASAMADVTGQFFVAIRLSDSGSRKLARVSADHIGQSLALVTGGYLMGSALIDAPIDKGLFAMAVTSRSSALALADFLSPDRPVQ
jgi:preprotein translocase subunit SecD